MLASEGEQAEVNALGGSSVPMSLPEVLPALQQGTIDGVNSVKGVFVAFKYYDTAPNLLETQLWPLISVALVSKVWFDRLPPDLRRRCSKPDRRSSPRWINGRSQRIAADTKAWTEKNGKIVKLAPSEQQEAARRVTGSAQPDRRQERATEGVLREDQGRVTASVNPLHRVFSSAPASCPGRRAPPGARAERAPCSLTTVDRLQRKGQTS